MTQPDQFKLRRQHLQSQLDSDAVIIIFSNNEVTRSNDTEFLFRQHSDFWYLTGFNEPEAVLVLTAKHACILLRAKDTHAEIWHGRRLGIEAAPEVLNVDEAIDIEHASEFFADALLGKTSLHYLFSQQAQFTEYVQPVLTHLSKQRRSDASPTQLHDVSPTLIQMRMVKSEQEITLMQRSADIAVTAHIAAMKATSSQHSESSIEALLHYHFALAGARVPAYNSIVASGENACILHYTENSGALVDGDLLLIDAGAEYQGYASDITRTFPVSGRFTQAQAQLYDIVLNAQHSAIEACRAGVTLPELQGVAVAILLQGLLDLGILQGNLQDNIDNETYKAFYMHGIGHFLGLDVHDVGVYKVGDVDQPLPENAVITIEPGLYIGPDADVPEQYKGIGIRIEDDVLIQKDGCHVLTADVPKSRDDIEALMQTNYTDPLITN